MKDFDRLLRAIAKDDPSTAAALLKKQPALATALAQKPRLCDAKVAHWLYARDTALHLAAAGHQPETVRALLRAGADVNAARNHRLGRPLHYAADGCPQSAMFDAGRQVRTIECLLAAGADIHAADKNGATALHRAVRTRCAAAVECLLAAGASPAARNHPGATAFHLAVQNTGRGGSGEPAAIAGQRRIIELMMASGASLMMKDTRGKSVRDWATSRWVKELLCG